MTSVIAGRYASRMHYAPVSTMMTNDPMTIAMEKKNAIRSSAKNMYIFH